MLTLKGIKGHQRGYITWLLEQCAAGAAPTDILMPEALELLAERLMTPLQIEHYLTRVLEQAYRVGEKPVTPAIVTQTLAPDLHGLEPTLTRYGYHVTVVAELLNLRHAEVRAFLQANCRLGGRKRSISSCWPPAFRSAIIARQPAPNARRDDAAHAWGAFSRNASTARCSQAALR